DFVFSYSTDNVDYSDMVTVTKTADDDAYQTYELPSSLSGTTYIRVVDTNHKKGKSNLDIIYIDQMFIRSSSGLAKQTVPILHDTEIDVTQPTGLKLYQNHPNPFNPRTTIRFDLSKAGHVKMVIFDMMGRMVSEVVDHFYECGSYSVDWEAVDSNGCALVSGVYLCRLQCGSSTETIKLLLIQ
ncbi:MAG: T9SS type A sorting domain-containing protein, partial [bacterium]